MKWLHELIKDHNVYILYIIYHRTSIIESPPALLQAHQELYTYHNDLDRHNDRIFMEKYGAVQVCFGEIVLLCLYLSYERPHKNLSQLIDYSI